MGTLEPLSKLFDLAPEGRGSGWGEAIELLRKDPRRRGIATPIGLDVAAAALHEAMPRDDAASISDKRIPRAKG
jgi:hypothetical protein